MKTKALGMIETMDVEVFKKEFDRHKTTPEYNSRRTQLRFIEIAQMTIKELIKRGKISNEDLSALIQMFGYNSGPDNFQKYLKNLKLPQEVENKIQDKYNEYGEVGFTGVGKSAVKDLTDNQLNEVKNLLISVSKSDDIKEIERVIVDYQDKKIPVVTSGIFSPWLFYLKPSLCPMVAGGIKKFLIRLGWNGKNYAAAMDFFEKLKNSVGEDHYAYIDSFLYEEENQEKIIMKPEKRMIPVPKINISALLKIKKQVILYGPPGTGKTFNTKELAFKLINRGSS